MLSKAFNRKQTTKNYPKIMKNNNNDKNNNLIVFKPKHPLIGCYETDAKHVPLSQTAAFNIMCLKWDLDLAYFQPQNKREEQLFGYLWVISPFFKLMQ